MAISHVCQSCGFDLASTRPIRDRHYQLPIIICPRCVHASVRMRHPAQQWWRTLMRYDAVATTITVHTLLLAGSLLLTFVACVGIPAGLALIMTGEASVRSFLPVIVLGALFPPALGAWLTAGFSHIARWRVFVGWASLASLCMLIPVFFALAAQQALPISTSQRGVIAGADTWAAQLTVAGMFWGYATLIIAMITATATSGIPLGLGLQHIAHRFRQWRWRLRHAYRRHGRFK